jgi:hypothetical protein
MALDYPFKDAPHPNAKISEPGVYPISIEQYHSDCCAGPSISSSGLRKIVNESPAHYWCDSYLNPEREEDDEPADHFTLGQAAHMLLLGESGFKEKFAIRPETVAGKPWQGNRTECREWVREQRALGISVLKPEDIKTIRGMAKSLNADPLVKTGILTGRIEQSLIWKDKETGVWLKARPDALPTHEDCVGDIKTCASSDGHSCERSLDEYGYHIQLGLTGMGIKALTGHTLGNDAYVLVFVEKKKPYAVNVKIIDPASIHYGMMLARKAIRMFADCMAKGEWPGYADSGGYLGLPKYRTDKLEKDIKNGMLDDRGL